MAVIGQGFVAVLLIGALVSFSIAVIGWWNRHKPGAFWFAVNAGVVGLWATADLISLVTTSESLTVIATVVGNIFSTVGTFTTLLFIASYLGDDIFSRRTELTATLLYTVTAVLFVSVTRWQGEFYTEYEVTKQVGYMVLSAGQGSGLLIIALVGIFWIFVSLVLLIRAGIAGDGVWRSNVVLLVIALIFPTAVAITLRGFGFPDGLPVTSALVTGTVLIYAYTLRREGLFELSPASERVGVRQAFDELGAGVFVIGSDQTILQANTTACDILDRPRSAVVGTDLDTVFEWTGIADAAVLPTDIERNDKVYQVTTSPLGDGMGSTVMLQDVTMRRERRELQRQNERLDKFASMVSHDLRNPLSIADTYIDFAEDTGDSEDFEAVRDAHERMDRMINDLLTLAQSGQTVETTEPVALADTASEAWNHADVDDCELDLSIPSDTTVQADRERLLHVFENLFRNAADHNDPPLTVRVGTLREVTTQSDGGSEPGFFIEDDGAGIPADEREDIFDHGYTTSDDGTGFGLSIVRDIVAAHGWEIRVADGSDGGARFEIVTNDTNY